MATFTISNETRAALLGTVDEAVADPQTGLKYAGVTVVSASSELFGHCAGVSQNCGDGNAEGGDPILWLASCTKLVTAIACMQLVERKQLRLDDPDQLEQLCPELKAIKVLQDDGSLVEKCRQITLRHLLTHTAGFGYSFLNDKLRRYKESLNEEEYDEFSGNLTDFNQSLVNQPGERFEYGISMDWAGILVERASGLRLNEYMTLEIFKPLGIVELSMFPSDDMQKRLIGISQRSVSGNLSSRKYPLHKPLAAKMNEEVFHSGGAGLFGSIQEYSKILAALLNNGESAQTGQRILSPETVNEMFINQLPDMPDFARQPLPAIKPELVYPAPGLYPICPPQTAQGWGLGFMISPSVTGRSETTGHWSGLSNVFWWCDRHKGVAGVVASQLLPFADLKTFTLWVEVETKINEGGH